MRRATMCSVWQKKSCQQLMKSNYMYRVCLRKKSSSPRVNCVNIQMLSATLHDQIFKGVSNHPLDGNFSKMMEGHLKDHDLWSKHSDSSKNVDLSLPRLYGDSIADHFETIANKVSNDYLSLAHHMANSLTKLPEMPNSWIYQSGWTKYNKDGTIESVAVPDENALVFDVETCVSAGQFPVLATAVSKQAWYCWVSQSLIDPQSHPPPQRLTPHCMIPMESSTNDKKLIIGHHVGFDRAFIEEQYQLQRTATKFLDTLSLHVCVSGVTNEQRNYLNSKSQVTLYDWMQHGTTNSLAKVFEFYCGEQLLKDTRDLFVKGTLDDIRDNFQECARYCATDVRSTHEVFQVIWPIFRQHAPHPVTFAGMLEMGSSFLPINQTWEEYISNSENKYNNIVEEVKKSLTNVADDALKLLINKRYKNDPWLWNMDWSLHKTVEKNQISANGETLIDDYIKQSVEHLSDKRLQSMHLPGYPKWFRDLCIRHKDHQELRPVPSTISVQTRVTPSLLRMTWDGYPLHYDRKYGWGYLKPNVCDESALNESDGNNELLRELIKVARLKKQTDVKSENDVNVLKEMYTGDESAKKHYDIGIPNVKFYQLPHKDGENNNVGNPLAKDFLEKMEDKTLMSMGGYDAIQAIQMNRTVSFWRNGRKRIKSQMTVWLDEENSKPCTGVILPQVITAGTITRRAVEPTWLTASNPRKDRLGSELKSVVRSPPGYCFVGADVDSQELWIASLLGDAQFCQEHGCTALSWMTLQGKKSDGTDLHSRTAATIGMSRDQAKVFNYGRIYGAGERFAIRMLKHFNHSLSAKEAEERATRLYKTTKGVKRYRVTPKGKALAEEMNLSSLSNDLISYPDLKLLLNESRYTWYERFEVVYGDKEWFGGSESHMFNKLESIALADEPRTPVLNCLITKALLPKNVGQYYKTSRVNWAVQSSAVDYLHLLLVSMQWLIEEYKIDARFSISIHDEVRYMVSEEDKYRCSLALQISNLLTRSLFAYKLGINDLPQSVAFFSSVDIDTVLRKEVDMDCVTPTNPQGLFKEHGISPGESLDIYQLLDKCNQVDLCHADDIREET